jgi:ABC-2 type transport system permease protein
MVDKKLRIMLINLNQLKAYSVNFLFRMAFFPIFIIITYFLWKVILENSAIPGMTLGFLVTYYVTIYAIQVITSQIAIAETISEEVVQGSMVVSLLRPISYRSYIFWTRALYFLFNLVLFLAILFGLSLIFDMHFTSDPLMIVMFLISLIFAFLMNFAMYFTIGLSAFWMEENWGLINTFNFITTFLAGTWIPLSLLSGMLKDITFLLPFRLTAYSQVSIIEGSLSLSQALQDIGLMIIWTAIFFFIAKVVWKMAERKYTGYGV